MMKRVVLTLLAAAFALSAFGQTAKYSNEFLSLGIGARGLG